MLKDKGFGYSEKRPVIVTILCLIGMTVSIVNISGVLFLPDFAHELTHYHQTMPIVSCILDMLFVFGYIGIWRMKIWGFALYALTVMSLAMYFFLIGAHTWIMFVISVIMLGVFGFYTRWMK